MNLLKSQQQLLQAKDKVVIVAEGRAKGATTSLYLKAITEGGHSLFCGGLDSYSNMSSAFRVVLKDLGIKYIMHRDFSGEKITWDNGLSSVLFVYREKLTFILDMKPNVDRVFIDNVDALHKEGDPIYYIMERMNRYKQMIFATNPFSCAYRNPTYVNGVLERDEEGNIKYDFKSWDYPLVNWKPLDKSKQLVTKASIEDYHSFVKVINNPLEVNPYCNMYEDIKGREFPWYDSMLLSEGWVDGD